MLFFPKNHYIKNKRKASKNHQSSPPDGCVGYKEKGAPPAVCGLAGSLSLEASMVLPFFLAGLIALLFFIQVIQLQMRLQAALYGEGMKNAGYAYYIDGADMNDTVQNVLEAGYIKASVIRRVGKEYLDSSCISGGSKGLHLRLDGNTEAGVFDAVLRYKVQVPFDLLGIGGITLSSRARCHIWNGDKDGREPSSRELVYMTEHGEVYHTYRDCTYLVSGICETFYGQLGTLRNDSGAKYYACAVCGTQEAEASCPVFYTKYGTRYHMDRLCGNLHSNIFSVEREEAEDSYRLCSKCGSRSG